MHRFSGWGSQTKRKS